MTCHRCGASTPLPDDLRAPSFACAFCGVELQTASFAGAAAVSADALLGHVNAVVRGEPPRGQPGAPTPRFQGGRGDSRAATCLHCGAPVAVPMGLSVSEFTCDGCGREQRVNRYISDTERLGLEVHRALAGNQALEQLRAEGAACSKCGGKNTVPDDGSVQLPCRFCGTAILLSDHVDPSAVARARLRHGVDEMRGELARQQAERDRLVKFAAAGLAVLVIALVVVANIASSP